MRSLSRLLIAVILAVGAVLFVAPPVQSDCWYCWREGDCWYCSDCYGVCTYSCPGLDGTC